MTLGTMKGSDYDGHDGEQARGEGLPDGKFRMSACGVCDGASGPLTVCCGDLLAAGAVPGSGAKVTLCVMHTARDGSLPEEPSRGSAHDVPLLLSSIAIFDQI